MEYINSINLNQETDFPYLVLNVINDMSYPRNPGFLAGCISLDEKDGKELHRHWRCDMLRLCEFIVVLGQCIGGKTMEFELLAGSFIKYNLKLVRRCRANLNYQTLEKVRQCRTNLSQTQMF